MRRSGKKLLKNEKGQSTVEFALTLILIMGLFLFFVQLAFLSAYGNFAHYATFMSARAYLAAGESPDDQTQRARNVLRSLLKRPSGPDRWPGIATAVGGDGILSGAQIEPPARFNKTNPDFSWLEGVRYTFRGRLFLVPLGSGASVNSLTLTSESWLGRETSFEECVNYMNQRFEGKAELDNGC